MAIHIRMVNPQGKRHQVPQRHTRITPQELAILPSIAYRRVAEDARPGLKVDIDAELDDGVGDDDSHPEAGGYIAQAAKVQKVDGKGHGTGRVVLVRGGRGGVGQGGCNASCADDPVGVICARPGTRRAGIGAATSRLNQGVNDGQLLTATTAFVPAGPTCRRRQRRRIRSLFRPLCFPLCGASRKFLHQHPQHPILFAVEIGVRALLGDPTVLENGDIVSRHQSMDLVGRDDDGLAVQQARRRGEQGSKDLSLGGSVQRRKGVV